MSQNRELEFFEHAPGRWFYLLEDYSAPKNSWDWREHAQCYGPFPSIEAAQYHQYDLSHISTPGQCNLEHADIADPSRYDAAVAGATLDRAH